MAAEWSDPGIAAIASVVERETGLTWPAGRRDSAESAIFRAMDRAGVSTLPRYLELIRTEPAAREELIAELTIGETYFFRDNNQFAALREVLLPDAAGSGEPARELRIWSAGCASGEEPYSLAILLSELGLAGRARVLGTDIARHRLAAARTGRYTHWSLRGVSPLTVDRYFRQDGKHFHLHHAVRDAVEFRYLNLAEDRYPSLSSGIWGMDLVLCRNVLIYFDRDTVARVAARLIASLNETGWLMLGASDPPIAEYVDCEVTVVSDGIAYRRADVAGRTAARPTFATAPAAASDSAVRSQETPDIAPDYARADVPPQPPDAAGATRPDDPAHSSAAGDAFVPSPPAETRPDPHDRVAAAPSPPAADAAAAYAARDYTRAAALAAAAIEAGDDAAPLSIVRVRALANLGRLREASRACSAALDRHGDSAELHYLLAVLLAEAGRPADAVSMALRALYLDRTLVVAHLALADSAGRAGDPPAARRSLRNAARLLAALPPAAEVPASDGQAAGRLAEIVRMRLRLTEAA